MADAETLRQGMVEGLARRGELTSSASAPAVVAQMLAALQVRHSGERKLWGRSGHCLPVVDRCRQPAVDAWRFTVTTSGQRIELRR